MAFDSSGNLYVADYRGNEVSEFAPGSTTPTTTLTGLNYPSALAFDSSGNLYVANVVGMTVSEFAPGHTAPTATFTGLDDPFALAFDRSGNLYVANDDGMTVSEFAPGHTTPTTTFTGLNNPIALALDPSGDLYVANWANGTGTTVSEFAPGHTTPTATLTGLSNPRALAFAPNGALYVANEGNNTVSEFATEASLVVSTQPSDTAAGASIAPAVQVSVEDANGNVVTDNHSSVTLAIGTNPGNGTLGGTLTEPTVNGVATFSDLSINEVGTGYTLTASDGSMTVATSGSFNITTAASQLAFSTQPSNAVEGASISPAVQVSVEDANGNVVTDDHSSVTLAIGTSPGNGTLGGTLTVPTVNGVATFSDLSINEVGTGYTLTASDGSKTVATSGSFNVTPPIVEGVSALTGAYGVGAAIPITVTFSDPVTVTGTPQLALDDGAVVNYTTGSGTSTLTFTYTVAAGQNAPDLDYTSTAALALNGGTVEDAAGNQANLSLPTPGTTADTLNTANIVIDTTAPTVTGVSSTQKTGTYGVGTVIPITVAFSEPVTVIWTPQLALTTGRWPITPPGAALQRSRSPTPSRRDRTLPTWIIPRLRRWHSTAALSRMQRATRPTCHCLRPAPPPIP